MRTFISFKIKTYLFVYVLMLALTQIIISCSRTEDFAFQNEQNTITNYRVTPEEAGNMALSLAIPIRENSTRSGEYSKALSVKNVMPLGKNNVRKTMTRSGDEDKLEIDTLIYIVNFADSNGFAIVSADKRKEPIYAIVDDGNASLPPEENDSILNKIITTLIYPTDTLLPENPKEDPYVDWHPNGWNVLKILHPILNTKWGQRSPYNEYCPVMSGIKTLTGCVPTAMSQIASFLQIPTESLWKDVSNEYYTTLHWDQIISDCKENEGVLTKAKYSQSSDEVAHLMRYFGEQFKSIYGIDGTATVSSYAIAWMQQIEGIEVSSLKSYSIGGIINCLRDNGIVYARGSTVMGGHAWVYDGYCRATKDDTTKYFVHCNWGWNGNSNGYYISKIFNTSSGPEFYDDIDNGKNSSGGNYNDSLEYATFYKK